MTPRYGMSIPFPGPLDEQARYFAALAEMGYTDLWSSEAGGADAFTPLALAAVWAPAARLGTAIAPAFTRGPGLMAMSVASSLASSRCSAGMRHRPGARILGTEPLINAWRSINHSGCG